MGAKKGLPQTRKLKRGRCQEKNAEKKGKKKKVEFKALGVMENRRKAREKGERKGETPVRERNAGQSKGDPQGL